MKLNSIFIDLRDDKQVSWWNNAIKRSLFAEVSRHNYIVETATNKKVGVVLMLRGLGSKRLIAKFNKLFIPSGAKMTFEVES